MKMADIKSRTWKKVVAIPTDDFSIAGIRRAIYEEFGVMWFEDVLQEIADGNIQIAEDGIIIWET